MAAGSVHGRELTKPMIAAYESALADLPESELRIALNETLRTEKFWPTPGHIREAWESRKAAEDHAGADQAWDHVLDTMYKIGRVYAGGFDDVTEFALRSIGGYLALCNSIPESDHRFVRKTFIDAYCRYRETAGYLGPSRSEAAALLSDLTRALDERAS